MAVTVVERDNELANILIGLGIGIVSSVIGGILLLSLLRPTQQPPTSPPPSPPSPPPPPPPTPTFDTKIAFGLVVQPDPINLNLVNMALPLVALYDNNMPMIVKSITVFWHDPNINSLAPISHVEFNYFMDKPLAQNIGKTFILNPFNVMALRPPHLIAEATLIVENQTVSKRSPMLDLSGKIPVTQTTFFGDPKVQEFTQVSA